MKILLCARAYNSIHDHRVGVFEFDQAKALRDAGHDVRIAAIDIRSIRHRRHLISYSYERDGIKVFTTNVPAGRLPFVILSPVLKRAGSKSCSLACEDGWRPDIIHAHFTECGYAFADIAQKLSIPYVITEHSSAIAKKSLSVKTFKQASYAYDKADAVIAVSRYLSDHIKQVFGIEPQVVYNTVEMTDPGETETEKIGFVFLSASNLLYGKGMDLLIDAFSRIKESCVRMVIMGDGPEKRNLIKQVELAGLSDRVFFTGRYTREQFAQALHQADAFVLASRGETFGVVYAEALLMGVPVIATKCGGPEEYIIDQNGILINPDDSEALVGAMKLMIAHAQEYDRIQIKNLATNMFSPEAIADRLTEIYSGLVG